MHYIKTNQHRGIALVAILAVLTVLGIMASVSTLSPNTHAVPSLAVMTLRPCQKFPRIADLARNSRGGHCIG